MDAVAPSAVASRDAAAFRAPAPPDAARVAREFEGIFLAQLWDAMQRTIPGGGPFGNGSAFAAYGALFSQQFATWLAGDGSNGLRFGLEEALLPAGAAPAGAMPHPDVRAAVAHYAAALRSAPIEPVSEVPAGDDPAFLTVARRVLRFDEAIAGAAREMRLDADLLRAMIHQESAGNPAARSPKGALGLMQLMPGTARDLGLASPMRPAENIRAGARYLRQLLERFGGSLAHALAAYNAGPGTVERAGGMPRIAETRVYVPRVLDLAARYRAGLAARAGGSSGGAAEP